MPPSLAVSLGLGLRALRREPWLVTVGVLIAILRRAALAPALAVAAALLARAAVSAGRAHPLDPLAPLAALAAAATSVRFAALVLGLGLAGAALGALLRVVWLSGALPTIGGAMAGVGGAARFAPGVAYGFPRVLVAAVLAFCIDVSADLYAFTMWVAGLRVAVRSAGSGASALVAPATALALTFAVAVPVALSAFADGSVARAAVRGEGPAQALAGCARRFLARPGTFVLAAVAFAIAGGIAPAALQAAGGAMTGFARGASPILLAGPDLVLALAALALAAALDLWWLGTVTALAAGGDAHR